MSYKYKMSHFFQINQELINYYEKLRTMALDKSNFCSYNKNDHGFSILLFRGMANWIKAGLHSELYSSDESLRKNSKDTTLQNLKNEFPNSSSLNRVNKTSKKDVNQKIKEFTPSFNLNYKKIVMLLTNMILFHQHKTNRNNYV